MDQKSKASDFLWDNLLVNKGFYAYAFNRDINLRGEKVDFFCDELHLAILFKEGNDQAARKLREEGYKVLTVEAVEVLSDFKVVTDYLTNTLKDIVGQPCGGW